MRRPIQRCSGVVHSQICGCVQPASCPTDQLLPSSSTLPFSILRTVAMQSPAGPARPHSFQAKAKPRARMLLMESRRAEALQRQQSGRQSKVQTVRDILESAWTNAENAAATAASAAVESTFAVAAAAASSASAAAAPSAAAASVAASPSGFRAESAYHRSLRAHWSHQLMMPEPLEHLPSDAASRWMLLSRPEGLRCLVVARRGRTLSRKKNGSVLHSKFASSLPHGGATPVISATGGQPVAVAGASASEDAAPSTILDCVWNEASGSYLILDALVWNNHHLADTEAEFRLFWIWAKMAELGAVVTSVPAGATGNGGGTTLRYLTLPASLPHVPHAFHMLEPLSPLMLGSLYPLDPRLARLGARQDGFLFLHRATHYEFGLSQLSLQWKDKTCSPYLIEDAGGNSGATPAAATAGKQLITLRLGPGRSLLTEDDETVGLLDELVYQTVRSEMRWQLAFAFHRWSLHRLFPVAHCVFVVLFLPFLRSAVLTSPRRPAVVLHRRHRRISGAACIADGCRSHLRCCWLPRWGRHGG